VSWAANHSKPRLSYLAHPEYTQKPSCDESTPPRTHLHQGLLYEELSAIIQETAFLVGEIIENIGKSESNMDLISQEWTTTRAEGSGAFGAGGGGRRWGIIKW